MHSCQGYASVLSTEKVTQKQKAKLRGIYMAKRVSPYENIKRFSEKKIWYTSDYHGQHASWTRALHTTSLSESIFPKSDDGDGEETEEIMDAVQHNAFEVSEIVSFRGNDGLPFNLLIVSCAIPMGSLNPRTRIRGDFLYRNFERWP